MIYHAYSLIGKLLVGFRRKSLFISAFLFPSPWAEQWREDSGRSLYLCLQPASKEVYENLWEADLRANSSRSHLFLCKRIAVHSVRLHTSLNRDVWAPLQDTFRSSESCLSMLYSLTLQPISRFQLKFHL